jgi:hypothetical protein
VRTRSERLFEAVYEATLLVLAERASTVPTRRGEAISLARAAANGAVQEDELRAAERRTLMILAELESRRGA